MCIKNFDTFEKQMMVELQAEINTRESALPKERMEYIASLIIIALWTIGYIYLLY